MRKFKIKLLFFIIIFLFNAPIWAQEDSISAYYERDDTTSIDYSKEIQHYAIESLLKEDTVVGVDNWEGEPAVKVPRPEPLGFIDTNYQRFDIHFSSLWPGKGPGGYYEVKGKTKVKNTICAFTGYIDVLGARMRNKADFPMYKQGYVIVKITLSENKSQVGSGIIKGTGKLYFAIDLKGNFVYDGLSVQMSDGFCNNQFECTWTSYKTGKVKKCNWGDFRIPDCGDLNVGEGEFSVNEKYLQNGWIGFDSPKKQVTWWKL